MGDKDYKFEDGSGLFDESSSTYQGFKEQGIMVEDGDERYFFWPTNLMGKARMELQLEPDSISAENKLIRKFGYTVIFLILVVYTIVFLFAYLKRLLMMAFLTMIAPLVAMTYPLDKLHDGSAQALNMWIKEYIFNLLIQPFHLLIYTILVGSAMDLAQNNMLYAMAAIGFILPAEKLLRKFFGFDKASTVAGGSAIGGALAMQGINQLRKLGSRGDKKENEKQRGGQNGNTEDTNKPRLSNNQTSYNDLINNARDESNQQSLQQQNQRQIQQSNQRGGEAQNRGQTDENEGTPSQRMLDAYNEQYGSSDWDPQEAEAMSRDAYGDNNDGMNYSADEYANILRDSGYNEDQIAEMMESDPRFSSPDQKMSDVYNEQYGSEDWDPQVAEAMSREAYGNDNDGMNYSADEYANILRDSGYDEDQIAEMMQKDPRYANSYKSPEISNNVPSKPSTTRTASKPITTRTASKPGISEPIDEKAMKKAKRKAIRGIIGHTVGNGIKQGIKFTAPLAGKVALGGFYGAAAGIAGIAAGLASDDYSNVLKYGATGVGAGWTVGGAAAKKLNQVPGGIKNITKSRNKRSK